MVHKPLALFLFLASGGDEAVGQRQSTSLQHLSPRKGLQGSPVQLLGDVALACAVPVTSAVGARILGLSAPSSQSMTSLELAKEVLLGITLAFLFACFLKRALSHYKVVLSTAQPTKGACSAEGSPQKGLTSLPGHLWTWLARPWQFGRRCVQRRRLHASHAKMLLAKALSRLEGILPSLCASSSPIAAQLHRASSPGSHGVHDWHEALPAGFLMPRDVAAVRSPPEVAAPLQRLLADRWWALEVEQVLLESVPEDECLA